MIKECFCRIFNEKNIFCFYVLNNLSMKLMDFNIIKKFSTSFY